MYQMKRFIIDMEHSPSSIFFLLLPNGLCSVTHTANEYSIYHFCVMIKDFSISFSRVIIVQDFETVIFLCIIWIQTDLCYFLLNKKGDVSSQFNSGFILYISTAKPFSLVRGYIQVKINKYEIW